MLKPSFRSFKSLIGANTCRIHFRSFSSSIGQSSSSRHNNERKSTFGRRLLTTTAGVVSLLAGSLAISYFYLKENERVSSEKFNAPSFECVHECDGKEVILYHRHYFQMDVPPIALSSNMSVVNMDGDLMVYNPVELNATVRSELNRLGQVKVIILPNRTHLKYAGQYLKEFVLDKNADEQAVVYCPEGNKEQVVDNLFNKIRKEYPNLTRNDLVKHIHVLPSDGKSLPQEWPQKWNQQFETQVISGLGGTLNEVLLLHKPTKTLLACDLLMNWTEPIIIRTDKPNHTPITVTYGKLIGMYGKGPTIPMTFRSMITDRNILTRELDRVTNEWQWNSVVMAHGHVLKCDNDEDGAKLRKDYAQALKENLKI